MTDTIPRPAYDPEVTGPLQAIAGLLPPTLTPDMIPKMRGPIPGLPTIDETIAGRAIERRDETIAGYEGAEIMVSVFRPRDRVGTGPGIYHTHGGGMVMGDRFGGVEPFIDWIERAGATVVTVEYRLAPEHPDPIPVEDCYAGLTWTAEHATELGIDLDRLVIAGASAGGGLAAGTALLARDRGGPALAGQVLMIPMLDDRNETVSSHQYVGIGVWDRGSNTTGWTALLGQRRGTEDVSIYAAPGRATDLSGLPPTYIDVGSAEVFRDEAVAYATAIWAAGGNAELHVWSGGFHGFELMAPQARISSAARQTRDGWLGRILGAKPAN